MKQRFLKKKLQYMKNTVKSTGTPIFLLNLNAEKTSTNLKRILCQFLT